MKFLSEVKLFTRLPADQHSILASACESADFGPGQVIIRQGDDGHEFFIIKLGEAAVMVDGQDVATLGVGDYFGENALLKDEPRTATIRAKGELEALKITRAEFENLGLRSKLEFPKRQAVGGGAAYEVKVKEPSPKTKEERNLIANALRSNDNLSSLEVLDDDRINQMIDIAWREDVVKGSELITEGDLNADYFYIVQRGSFQVQLMKSSEHKSAETAEAQVLKRIGPGGSFGELALLYFAPRAATVKASDDSMVWVIDRSNFKKILAKSREELTREYVKYLDKVETLSPLKKDEKEALAKSLNEMCFAQGETIFSQGEKSEIFYILISGQVSVMKDMKESTKLAATPQQVAFFGEKALLRNEPRSASIIVTSNDAKALTLDRQSFEMLLGSLEDLKKRGKYGKSKLEEQKDAMQPDSKRFGQVARKELKRLGLLGCGGFGSVELVEHVKTQATYALKALSKGYVVKAGMQESVISEKEVQLMCDSPFIIKLYETYNCQQQLFFLLELALGGELYATYNKKGFFGKEAYAKFYVAGVVNAFEHLHGKKIIFRDLKPENLLLNEKGNIKLTDMGLAKVVLGKTFTTCGTPDYFAPEMVASSGHTLAVDWWTLGVLAYELMCGNPPFEAAQPFMIYQKVTKGISRVPFPPKCRGPLEELIKSLCRKEPAERLPMKKGGSSNLKNHPWYKFFDWEKFDNLTLPPPYVPPVQSQKDASNFSARKEDLPPKVPYKDTGSGWDKGFATSS
eukprot:CAMPEP_0197688552 /NCGR_PEP_ID=MMETSP1338-20131121/105612_1 /TAXON_ID=43686 ORGANISM="Pelagodinium beii, Strain RCC1491" /NCGR_SAMPLE_ID=MMETSP1338 /ASSEMBLY_ACC=CAM_ASM_000754 /LENGTH=744 /DNA_ID=CAMNT_0043270771 /DNA_START=28 /DNA_END=2262 /DNA_ORIENTATION=+